MLVQRSAKDTTATAAQVPVMAAQPAAAPVQFGAVARLGRDTPAGIRTWLAAAGPNLKIADPESWTRVDQHRELNSNYSAQYPHLNVPRGTSGSMDEAIWLDAVVLAQTAANADVVLTPGLWTPSGGRVVDEIALMGGIVARAGDRPVWLNIALDPEHVLDAAARAVLISDLLNAGIGDDSGVEAVYLRTQIPGYSPSYTEPRWKDIQDHIAEIVSRLAEGGVPVILPNLGLTGMVMTGFGARGFGTGTSFGQRVWLRPARARQGVGRYLEPDMLHTVTAVSHLAIQAVAPTPPCTCAHCGALWSAGRATLPANWSFELAGLHYLGHVAGFTRSLPAGSPRSHLLGVVSAATARANTVKALTPNPMARMNPTHLGIWDRLLR